MFIAPAVCKNSQAPLGAACSKSDPIAGMFVAIFERQLGDA